MSNIAAAMRVITNIPRPCVPVPSVLFPPGPASNHFEQDQRVFVIICCCVVLLLDIFCL